MTSIEKKTFQDKIFLKCLLARDCDAVKKLVEQGADINTPVVIAAEQGHVDVIKVLAVFFMRLVVLHLTLSRAVADLLTATAQLQAPRVTAAPLALLLYLAQYLLYQ